MASPDDRLQALEEKITRLTVVVETRTNTCERHESRIDKVLENYNKLENRFVSLESTIQNLTAAIDRLNVNINALKTVQDEHGEQLGKIDDRVTALEAHITRFMSVDVPHRVEVLEYKQKDDELNRTSSSARMWDMLKIAIAGLFGGMMTYIIKQLSS